MLLLVSGCIPAGLGVVVESQCRQPGVVRGLTQGVQTGPGAPVVGQVIDDLAPSGEPGPRLGQDDVQLTTSTSLTRVDHEDWYTDVNQRPDGRQATRQRRCGTTTAAWQ